MTSKAQDFPTATAEEGESCAEPAAALEFTGLYEQHVDFVFRSVRMLGLATDVADDAVQDVFLVAHRRLADFEARSSPRTWLFAISVRVVSDYRRSQRRRVRLLERAENMEREACQTPFDGAVSSERRNRLLETLEQLPDEQRLVFMLAELEEMRAPEIASALGVNLNTVYSRLRAARRVVTDMLAASPEPDQELP